MGEAPGALLALVAVVGGVLAMSGALHLTARRGYGFWHYFHYAVLLSVGVLVASSGRSLALPFQIQGYSLSQTNPVALWTTRLSSAFLILASLERIVSRVLRRGRPGSVPYTLLFAFVFFWCTTVASPALLGAEGSFAHEYVYSLLIGCAALLLNERESDAAVASVRIGLLLFLIISVALIPLRPELVIDAHYVGGLLPGVPRFSGVAPSPVSLGMLAELALLCLYAKPISLRWLNYLCWALGLLVLFLAQSKASWLSFPVGVACMFWTRRVVATWGSSGDLRRRLMPLFIPVALLVASVLIGTIYMAESRDGDPSARIMSGQRGTELKSFTGRDQIWSVALEEWSRHPVFGYGTNLFDESYRAVIKMPWAFDGHSQFIDTLARSGLVGAAGLVLYALVLLVYSVRFARISRGLSIAVFLTLAMRCVTEVPMGLFGYGPEALGHFLLLAILAGHASARSANAARAGPEGFLVQRAGLDMRQVIAPHATRQSTNS